jgi:fatty acid desaturase
MDKRKIGPAILGLGMAVIAAWMNINNQSAFFLWLGVFFCAWQVLVED